MPRQGLTSKNIIAARPVLRTPACPAPFPAKIPKKATQTEANTIYHAHWICPAKICGSWSNLVVLMVIRAPHQIFRATLPMFSRNPRGSRAAIFGLQAAFRQGPMQVERMMDVQMGIGQSRLRWGRADMPTAAPFLCLSQTGVLAGQNQKVCIDLRLFFSGGSQ